MPPQTTRPPLATAASAAGTRAPTGAKMIAASSGSGGASLEPPAHSASSDSANFWEARSPSRVKAKTRRPCQRQSCATICAAAPKPYMPIRSASPAAFSERQPISPAQSSGAAATGSSDSASGKA